MVQDTITTSAFCEVKVDRSIVFSAPAAINSKNTFAAVSSQDFVNLSLTTRALSLICWMLTRSTQIIQPYQLADILTRLTAWGKFRFRTETIEETFQEAIRAAEGFTGRRYKTNVYPFDFILANLSRLPMDLLKSEKYLPLLADGLYEAGMAETGYLLSTVS